MKKNKNQRQIVKIRKINKLNLNKNQNKSNNKSK